MASRRAARAGSEEQRTSQDLYTETTARIIAALQRGAVPWVRPWSQIADAIPINAHTRRPYRGVNFTLLSLEAPQARGFGVNRWLTYRHAQELGGQVRKGERGTPIVFWQLRKIGVVAEGYPEREDDPPAPAEKIYPLLRAYTVFNVAQIDGLDAFADGAGYYTVALHELTHWTGHPSRCQRDLTGRFGAAGYAAEELVAEMSAA